MSIPTTLVRSIESSSRILCKRSAIWNGVVPPGHASLYPIPGQSNAITSNSLANCFANSDQICKLSGYPCSRTTGGPLPTRAIRNRRPEESFLTTVASISSSVCTCPSVQVLEQVISGQDSRNGRSEEHTSELQSR